MRHSGTDTFETPRLICRRFVPDDCADMLKNWASDPRVQHEYGEPAYETAAQTAALLAKYAEGYRRQDFYRWAIVERASGENIGQIAFCRVYSDIRTAEIEYCIGRRFQGRGYAGEALAGLIGHVFAKTEFFRLEAYCRLENTASGRVLDASPMHVAETVERFRREGRAPHGEMCYCITRDMYIKLKAPYAPR